MGHLGQPTAMIAIPAMNCNDCTTTTTAAAAAATIGLIYK